MNDNYEEKKRFNIVDAIIILGVLVIAASIIFRAQIITFFSSDTTKDEYTIRFEADYIDNSLLPFITSGNLVTWIDNDVSLGMIDRISSSEKAKIYESDASGKLTVYESETHSKIVGEITVEAISNSGCYIDGIHLIAAGMNVTLSTKNIQFNAVITSVNLE